MLWKPLFSFITVASILASSALAYYDDYDLDAREDLEGVELEAREELAIRVLSELATRRYGVDIYDLFSRSTTNIKDDPDYKLNFHIAPKSLPKPSKLFLGAIREQFPEAWGSWNVIGKPSGSSSEWKKWRVYKSAEAAKKAQETYTAAASAGLPLAEWKFDEAKIQFVEKGATGPTAKVVKIADGGVIVEDKVYAGAKGTTFKSTEKGGFQSALMRSAFPQDKDNEDYKKLLKAAQVIKKLGIKTFEAKLEPGVEKSVVFYNIGAPASENTQLTPDALLSETEKWPTTTVPDIYKPLFAKAKRVAKRNAIRAKSIKP